MSTAVSVSKGQTGSSAVSFQLSAVPMGFSHVVLDEGMSRTITFGGMRDRIKA